MEPSSVWPSLHKNLDCPLKIGRRDKYERRSSALEGEDGAIYDATYGACQTTVIAMVKRLDMASHGRSYVPTIMACRLQRTPRS